MISNDIIRYNSEHYNENLLVCSDKDAGSMSAGRHPSLPTTFTGREAVDGEIGQ